jgi:membrane-bound lytic murein transglycosylase B
VEGRILLPSGRRGPTFLIYDNFDVIMGWNRSEHYALTVGLFADQIAGSSGLVHPQPKLDALPRDTLKRVQARLQEQGFDPGEPDGLMGPRTRRAIGLFQHSADLPADGYPDAPTLQALGL